MWTGGRLTQEQAAELLGVSARTFRRWTDRYGEDGIEGLRDRRVSRASHRAVPVDEVMAYFGFFRFSDMVPILACQVVEWGISRCGARVPLGQKEELRGRDRRSLE